MTNTFEFTDSGVTSITIENFKGVSSPVTIPLKPITLLFGKNSAGKSTILQSMLYAMEVIRTKNADIDKVQLGGNAIYFGGFSNVVHKHDVSRNIRFRFDIDTEGAGIPVFDNYHGGDSFCLDELKYPNTHDSIDLIYINKFYIELIIGMENNKPAILSYNVGISEPDSEAFDKGEASDKDEVFEILRVSREGSVTNATFNMNHPVMSGALEAVDDYYEFSTFGVAQKVIDGTGNVFVMGFKTCLPDSFAPVGASVPQNVWEKPDFFANPDKYNMKYFKYIELLLSSLLVGTLEYVYDLLSNMRYIGPVREIPRREYLYHQNLNSPEWSGGLAAWDILANAAIPQTDENDSLVETVNDYMSKTMKLGYEIVRKDFLEIDTNNADKIDLSNVDNLPVRKHLGLKDLSNNIEVAPHDIGVGISQVIPVVVGVVSASGHRVPIIAIEQPELHLHPAAQCDLGDLFIREKKDKRLFLIETHSEHLILRLLRRISETSSGEIKDESLSLHPQEIAVYYVHKEEGELKFTEMPIDEDGEFTRQWPEGFFGERAIELFGESDV